MATRENARWKNKRRKSLYNKEDTRNNFIYRSSSPSPPAEPPALDPSLDPPVPSPPLPALSFPPPELSINDPSKAFPSPPIAPPTPFRGPTNDLPKAVIRSTPLIAPPTPFRTIEVDDRPRPSSPPLIAPPTPFRTIQVNDPPRRNKRKKRKIDDEEPSQEKDMAIYLNVKKVCRMEIDKLEKIIQSEVLAETDVDEMISKKSSSFDKERINDSYHSIRKRIDAIEMHIKRKKEMLLCIPETPRAIIHKLSAHASKVINTPSLTHK